MEQLPGLLGRQGEAGPYLEYVVRLWELAALQRVGNDGIVSQVSKWAAQDDVLRLAIREYRQQALKQPANRWVASYASKGDMDEVFQPSYCDDCGAELDVDGVCVVCEVRLALVDKLGR